MVRVLSRIGLQRAVPKTLFCDHGTEFTSQAMDLWAYHAGVRIDFSRPGKPTDNAYVESFNGTLRLECLDAHWFASLTEAKQIIEAWRREYNESRHRAHGERTPHKHNNCRRLTLRMMQKKGASQEILVSYDSVRGARGQITSM